MHDEFGRAYLEAAVFTDCGPDGECHDAEFAACTMRAMERDCANFQEQAGTAIGYGDWTKAGHDFWLTRNGHGVGFWDGDWPEPAATTLDNLAKSFGAFELYRGDDGLIYAFGYKE